MAVSRLYTLGAILVLCFIWSVRISVSTRWQHELNLQNIVQQPEVEQIVGGHHDVEKVNPASNNGERINATQKDLLVVYAYHESDNALANARFFMKHALHANADFLFLINGQSLLEKEIPTHLSNIYVRLRENTCYDLGSYGEILGQDDRLLAKKYKKFILLNSSIRGPFLPVWSRECWTDIYRNMVTDTVKLAAMTFNCPGHHLHSMIYATDQIGLSILLDNCFSVCFTEMDEAVHCEQHATQYILDAGYDIDALMTAYHGEFEGGKKAYYQQCDIQDVNVNNEYFGFNIHPYETVFVKANRDIGPKMIEKLSQWHDTMNSSSWDVCSI